MIILGLIIGVRMYFLPAGAEGVSGPHMHRERNVPEGYREIARSGLTIVFKEGYAETFREFALP